MPTYCLKCKECGNSIEVEKKMSENFTKKQLKCYKCNGKMIRDFYSESSATIIPEYMRAGYEDKGFNYDIPDKKVWNGVDLKK